MRASPSVLGKTRKKTREREGETKEIIARMQTDAVNTGGSAVRSVFLVCLFNKCVCVRVIIFLRLAIEAHVYTGEKQRRRKRGRERVKKVQRKKKKRKKERK